MTTPRIYVACLASYNAGTLFGKWIDATTDIDAMNSEIQELLAQSPEPNVTRQRYTDADGAMHWVDVESRHIPDDWEKVGEPYRSAEEWAIHDHDGLGSDLGEYAGLAEVARRVAIIELAEDRGIPANVLLAYAQDYMTGGWDADDLESEVDDNSWADFAQERVEETDSETLDKLPDWIRYHIDWEGVARDWEIGGDWSAYRDGETGALYFFRTP
jgi:antirestriction protein